MHYPLPESVLTKIIGISANVDYKVTWCYVTQTVYPGEQCWDLEGGADLPYKFEPSSVAVYATRDGVKVYGKEAVKTALETVRRELRENPADADLQNNETALVGILQILDLASNQ